VGQDKTEKLLWERTGRRLVAVLVRLAVGLAWLPAGLWAQNLDAELMNVARSGDNQRVLALLQASAAVNTGDRFGWTPLMEAARQGHAQTVQTLVEAGADVNRQDEFGWTALMDAAHQGHTETVQVLLEAGADTDRQDKFGSTALLEAARRSHAGVVRLLLEAGVEVNASDDELSFTALMWAALENRPEIVRNLVEAGADVNLKDGKGFSAVDYTRDDHIVDLLVEAGAQRADQAFTQGYGVVYSSSQCLGFLMGAVGLAIFSVRKRRIGARRLLAWAAMGLFLIAGLVYAMTSGMGATFWEEVLVRSVFFLWLAAPLGSFYLAGCKGRGRLIWTLLTLLLGALPLLVLLGLSSKEQS
jgi:hypothetical protein